MTPTTADDPSARRYGANAVYRPGPLKPYERLSKPATIIQKALRASGIELSPGEGLHTIRRSVARAFFEREAAKGNDIALRATSALLHHSSTQVTEIYLGLNHERVRRNTSLRGQTFLSGMVTAENVIPLRSLSDTGKQA